MLSLDAVFDDLPDSMEACKPPKRHSIAVSADAAIKAQKSLDQLFSDDDDAEDQLDAPEEAEADNMRLFQRHLEKIFCGPRLSLVPPAPIELKRRYTLASSSAFEKGAFEKAQRHQLSATREALAKEPLRPSSSAFGPISKRKRSSAAAAAQPRITIDLDATDDAPPEEAAAEAAASPLTAAPLVASPLAAPAAPSPSADGGAAFEAASWQAEPAYHLPAAAYLPAGYPHPTDPTAAYGGAAPAAAAYPEYYQPAMAHAVPQMLHAPHAAASAAYLAPYHPAAGYAQPPPYPQGYMPHPAYAYPQAYPQGYPQGYPGQGYPQQGYPPHLYAPPGYAPSPYGEWPGEWPTDACLQSEWPVYYGAHHAYLPPVQPQPYSHPMPMHSQPMHSQPMQPTPPMAMSQPMATPPHTPPPTSSPPPPLPPTASYTDLAYDKDGSQALQAQLPHMAPEELGRVVTELSPHLLPLATHAYGNYLVSALLASAPASHRAVLQALQGHVLRLTTHVQGCRVVQKAFACLPPSDASALVAELAGHVASVACDMQGKYSLTLAYRHTAAPFIVREAAAALTTLAPHRHGSLLLQRLLDPKRKLLPPPAAAAHAASAASHPKAAAADEAAPEAAGGEREGGGDGDGGGGEVGAAAGGEVGALLEAVASLSGEALVSLATDPYANFVVKLALLHPSACGGGSGSGGSQQPAAAAAACGNRALVGTLLPHLPALSVTQWGSHVAKVVVGAAEAPEQLEAVRSLLGAARDSLRTHPYGSFVTAALDARGA